MRNFSFFLFLGTVLFLSGCGAGRGANRNQEQPLTVVLVRHAEKAAGENPELTLEGKSRAQQLAVLLQEVPLNAVFSTNTRRTMATAQPTADDHRLSVEKYDGTQLSDFAQRLLRRYGGQTVLVVGHADTTPALAGLLAPGQSFQQFPDDDYNNIWIVVNAGTSRAQVLRLNRP